MKELQTAAELRKQYETAMGLAAQVELKTVIQKINNATGLSIYLNKALSKPVEAILVEKGYKCGFVQTGINESEYKISW